MNAGPGKPGPSFDLMGLLDRLLSTDRAAYGYYDQADRLLDLLAWAHSIVNREAGDIAFLAGQLNNCGLWPGELRTLEVELQERSLTVMQVRDAIATWKGRHGPADPEAHSCSR